MKITSVLRIIFYILFIVTPTSSWALFTVNGQATVHENSRVGTPGETIEFNFSYKVSDFAPNAEPDDQFSQYSAFTPIPITVTGSISGEFSVNPIRGVRFPGNSSNGHWSFLFTSIGASARNNIIFERPIFFSDAHAIFFPLHDDPSVWIQNLEGEILVIDDSDDNPDNDILHTIRYRGMEWKITGTEDETDTMFRVTNTNDEGIGSLRQAVINANNTPGNNTIEFDSQLNGQTLILTSGEILITDDIIIRGLGADNLTISGNSNSAIFHSTDKKVFIDGLAITDAGGDAIKADATNLVVSNCLVSSNQGHGIANNGGHLKVIKSSISDNTLSGISGRSEDINNPDGSSNLVTLTDSTFSNNGRNGIAVINLQLLAENSTIAGNNFKGISYVGGTVGNPILRVRRSTVFNNNGGGIYIDTRSELNDNSTFGYLIENTTISSNKGIKGSGIFLENVGDLRGHAILLSVRNSTITGNSATQAGGGVLINDDSDFPGSAIRMSQTIIAGNSAPMSPDVVGSFDITQGSNLIGNIEGSTGLEDDLIEPDITKILDSVLQDNNGSTQTHGLVTDSPAIDAGGADCPETDQRGLPRAGLGCDIGAFEKQQQSTSGLLTVTNTNDSGAGSLRQAINDANSSFVDDTIQFDSGLEGQTIILTSGPLRIGDGETDRGVLTINGLGADKLTISGGNSSAAFFVRDTGKAIIDGLTITETKLNAVRVFRDFSGETSLTMSNCIVAKNAIGAAVEAKGITTVDNCIIRSNEGAAIRLSIADAGYVLNVSNSILSENSGSAIVVTKDVLPADSDEDDNLVTGFSADISVTGSTISNNKIGILSEHSNLTVINSTISSNSNGAIASNNGITEIIGSTLSDSENGSGIRHTGFFIADFSPFDSISLMVTNTTISGNSAGIGGGIYVEDQSDDPLPIEVTLSNATITGNSATEQGGGILLISDQNNSTSITANNSIIAGNSAPTNPDVAGNFISNGFNLVGVPGDSTGFEGDIIEPDITNILDSDLKDNGGSTQTHNLLSDSVAIDATGSDCPPPVTDQRGVSRPQGAACDIGAVEFREADVPVEVSMMCEIRTDYEPGSCEGKFSVSSLDDLEAYKASSFGKEGRENYRNLVIRADIGSAGDILDIESPCKIYVSNGVALAGDFVSLDGRKGVRTNTIDIDSAGSACLLSETESARLKHNSTVTAKELVLRANKIAKLGENVQVNVSDSLTVLATGSPSESRAIIDKGANLLVGSNMMLNSDYRAVIQNNAIVDVSGYLEMNARDCLVKNSAEISFGSKLGVCAANLP